MACMDTTAIDEQAREAEIEAIKQVVPHSSTPTASHRPGGGPGPMFPA
jgi:hypothetical protein